MIINKRNRDEVLKKRIELLKDKSGEETLEASLSLIKLNLAMCEASIKEKNPKITQRELLKELNKIYWRK